MSITNNPAPNSNPLGDSAIGGTTDTNLGKVTTGGQNANVKQQNTIKGTEGVALHKQDQVGESTPAFEVINLSGEAPDDPGDPKIAQPREFKAQNKVCEWLTSTFLSKLTENFAIIADLGKEIHKAEGQMAVQMLKKVWETSVGIAALIMAKAQTEANMHLALAISAMVGLAVAIAGTALSLAGSMKVGSAKARKEALKSDTDAPEVQKNKEVKAGPSADAVGSRVAPKPLPKRPVADVDAPDQPVVQQQPQPGQGGRVNANGRPVDADVQNAQVNQNRAAANANDPNRAPVDAGTPETVGNAPAPKGKTTMEKIIDDKNTGQSMSIVGQGMQTAANSIREILDNVIQMIFKPILARYDGDIEKQRAVKDLASKALDSCIQAFNSGTDIVDAVARARDKLSEVIKANSINSRS